jgi:solute:Na+ symporter, SSS family
VEAKITWVFVFVILYWSYCLYWGVRGAIEARSAVDYFIAGRQLGFWVFICAATATSFSGWTFLGHPGQTYRDGFAYSFASFYAITIPLTGVLFLKRQWLLGRHFGFITPGEMLAAYFRSKLIRLLVVVVALVFSVPYVGLQLRASGFLFSVLTDNAIGVEFGTWVLAIVVVSYVATGGLKTAAYVDMLQVFLLAAGIVVIGVITLTYVGDFDRFTDGIAALSAADTVRTPAGYSHYVAIPGAIQVVSDGSKAEGSPWTGFMIMTYLLGLMGIQSSPAFSMWAFASRSPAAFAPQQVWASSLVMGLILILFTAVQGIGGHFLGIDRLFMAAHPELTNPVVVAGLNVTYPLAWFDDTDLLVPLLINLVGATAPWLVGLLAVCALSAMESTASCYMVTAGGILTRDLFLVFALPAADDRTQKFVGRIGTLLVVLLALAVATTGTDALVLMGGLAVSYGLQMWPALVAVCYWPFLTRQGVTAGLVVGLIVVTLTEGVGQHWLGITAWGRWPLTIHAAGWGIAANFGIAIVVSLLTKDDREHKLTFHRVVRAGAALSPRKRPLVPLAWALTLSWLVVAVGPAAVIGNSLFGDPNEPSTWWIGIPSLWIWQVLGWALGVGLMWFLAYGMELGTSSPPKTDASSPMAHLASPQNPSIRID